MGKHIMKKNIIIPSAEPFFFNGNDTGCLLIHGFTGTPKEMRLMGEYLADKNYTVMGIRLTGHATQISDMIRTRWWDWMADVEDAIDLLAGITKKIYAIGLSMGGVLALTAAARYRIDGVIAMSTPWSLPDDRRLNFIRLISYFSPEISKGTPDWVDPQLSKNHVSYRNYPTRSIAELKQLLDIMHISLPKVMVPTLLMQSVLDTTINKDSAKAIYESIGTKNKKIFMVHNSGHVITREPDKELVFNAAHEFIQNNNHNKIND